MPDYRRRLPHVQPVGKVLFITFRLHGSLPPSRYPPADKKLSAGEAFVWIDRYLDTTRVGPLFLKQAAIAGLVVRAIRFGAVDLGHYKLQAFAVMPNHVHLLVLPEVSPRQFMQTLKGFTAREANKVLGRTGEPFWQREYYDHWVRDAKEHTKIISYIENNPVQAGLVQSPEDYRWSSAWQGAEEVSAVSPARGLDARNQRAVSKRRG